MAAVPSGAGQPPNGLWMTVGETAAELHVSADTIVRLIRERALRAADVSPRRSRRRSGRERPSWRIRRVDLDRFLEGRMVGPEVKPARRTRRKPGDMREFITD